MRRPCANTPCFLRHCGLEFCRAWAQATKLLADHQISRTRGEWAAIGSRPLKALLPNYGSSLSLPCDNTANSVGRGHLGGWRWVSPCPGSTEYRAGSKGVNKTQTLYVSSHAEAPAQIKEEAKERCPGIPKPLKTKLVLMLGRACFVCPVGVFCRRPACFSTTSMANRIAKLKWMFQSRF